MLLVCLHHGTRDSQAMVARLGFFAASIAGSIDHPRDAPLSRPKRSTLKFRSRASFPHVFVSISTRARRLPTWASRARCRLPARESRGHRPPQAARAAADTRPCQTSHLQPANFRRDGCRPAQRPTHSCASLPMCVRPAAESLEIGYLDGPRLRAAGHEAHVPPGRPNRAAVLLLSP